MTVVGCRRITVVTDRMGSTAVDLAVPDLMDVGDLMPWVVDLAGAQRTAQRAGFADRWTLSRVGGAALDESTTLRGNDVRDGDILVLSVDPPPAAPYSADLIQHVVDAAAPTDVDTRLPPRLAMCTWWWSAGFGAIALSWPSRIGQDNRALTAVGVALVATIASIVASRIHMDTVSTVSSGITAVLFGGVGGFLVVPGGPAPANVFLAAAACFAASSVLLRLTGCGLGIYTTTMTFSLMVAIAAAAATMWTIPMATVGAVLAATSVAMQAVASTMAVSMAGLSPRLPGSADDAVLPSEEAIERAVNGHRVLTGLTAGLSSSAALGAVLVVADPHGSGEWRRLVLVGVVTAALAFRACEQCGTARSASVLMAVLITATAAFTKCVTAAPQQVPLICLVAVVVGASGVWLSHTDIGSRVSPLVRRGVEYCEYVALAAVVPMACWVGGLFGAVRGLSLS